MRGKQAAASAARRAREGAESEIETYQLRVRDLTAALQQAKSDHAAEVKALTEDNRILRAQRDEGTTPRVLALESELRRLRSKVDAAQAETKDIKQKYQKFWDQAMKVLIQGKLARNGREAMGLIMGITIVPDDVLQKPGSKADQERVVQLMRARGLRFTSEIDGALVDADGDLVEVE